VVDGTIIEVKQEQGATQQGATTFLLKRGDEKCFNDNVFT
jgi:hypothetical protein